MEELQQSWPMIGDVVESRAHPDRRALQVGLSTVLERANRELDLIQPFHLTVGDEFQGILPSFAAAARASLLVRLELLAATGADTRFGIGRGAVSIYDAERSPVSQDGPGWWTARAAIGKAKDLASTPRTSFVRTWYVPALDPERRTPVEAPEIAAFLLCRDALLDPVKPRDRMLLLGLLRGANQRDLAAQAGITQGAVSQALRRSGAYAVAAAQASLEA